MKYVYKLFIALTFICLNFSLLSQAGLNCNDHVTVGLDVNCDADDLTIDMFTEGDGDWSGFDFVIVDGGGNAVDYTNGNVMEGYVGQTLTVHVYNVTNGNSCWGSVTFEDKTPPTFDCRCPVGGDIPAGVPLANPFFGELTTTDIVADFTSMPCWPAPPTAEPHFVDLYTFTVDVTGVYTLTMMSFGDGIAAIYEDTFDPDDPCAEAPIVQDDDSFGIGSEPQLVTNLVVGTTYVLVSSGWNDTDLGTYSWSYSGPGNLVTLEPVYDPDCILSCFEWPLVKGGYEFTIPFDFLVPGVDDILDGVEDNCNNYNEEDLTWVDEYIDYGDCSRKFVRRTYSVSYDWVNESDPFDTKDYLSCTQEFVFEVLTLSDTVVLRDVSEIEAVEDSIILPLQLVELPCGAGTSPEEIAAFFDNPATEDRDTDDDNDDPDEGDIDLVIEDHEGIPYA